MSEMNIAGFGLGGGDEESKDSSSNKKDDKYSGPVDDELAGHRRAKFQKIAFAFVVLFGIYSAFTQGSDSTDNASPKEKAAPKQVGPQKVVPLWYNG